MNEQNKREVIAAVQHEIWKHWMKYLFDCCSVGLYSSNTIIPPDKVERWKRQMNIPYVHLTEQEKDSDREQADKVIAAIEQADRQEKDELLFALGQTQTPFEAISPQPGVIQIYRNGDRWCAFVANGDQSVVAAFGSTAVEALTNLQQPEAENGIRRNKVDEIPHWNPHVVIDSYRLEDDNSTTADDLPSIEEMRGILEDE